MEIVPLIRPNSGADFWRLKLPFQGMGVDFSKLELETVANLLKECKIVIFNRVPAFDLEILLRLRNHYGFKIVVDVDDYWELPVNSIYYNSWKVKETSRNIREAILNSDYVFTSTNRLAQKALELNPNVEVVPNAIPFGEGQFTDTHELGDNCRIMYAGGVSHFWDLHSIRGVFDKLSRNKTVQLQLAGYSEENESTAKYWKSAEKIVTANGKIKNYARKHILPLDMYMAHYETADISIAPLEGNYFNRFKSNIKILEAGCKRIPIVCSRVPPYSDEEGEFISMASTTKEWYDLLHGYIKNPNKLYDDGYMLGDYVRQKYDLVKANEIRKQIFNHLMK